MISKKILILVFTWIIVMGVATGLYAAGDPAAGAVKFESCLGCHGHPGAANAYPRYKVPKLGGQHAGYLVSALKAYKTGLRPHGTMQGNARGLTEADMENIASFLEGMSRSGNANSVSGNIRLGEKSAESCAACHGPKGDSSDQNFPRLGGQYQTYLTKALQDYQSGVRKNAMMSGMVSELSGADIENISAFYASQSDLLSVVED